MDKNIGQAVEALIEKTAFSPNLLKPGLTRLGQLFGKAGFRAGTTAARGATQVSKAAAQKAAQESARLAAQAAKSQAARKAAYAAGSAGAGAAGAAAPKSVHEVMAARRVATGKAATTSQTRGYLKSQGQTVAGAKPATWPPPKPNAPPVPPVQPKAPVQTPPVTPTPTPVQPQAPPVPTATPDPTLGSRTIGGQAEQLAGNYAKPKWYQGRLPGTTARAERQAFSTEQAGIKQRAKQESFMKPDVAAAESRQATVKQGQEYAERLRATGASEAQIEAGVMQRFGGKKAGTHSLDGGGNSVVDRILNRTPANVPGAKTPAKVPGGGDKVVRDSTGKVVSEGGGGTLGQTPVGESAKKLSQMSPAQYMEWIKANPGKAALGGLGIVGGMHVAGNVLGGGSRRRGGGAIATY